MAKMARPGLRVVDRLVLLVAWVATCGVVYLMGFYLGKGTQEGRLRLEERVVRLPIVSSPPAEGQRPKTSGDLTFYEQLLSGGRAGGDGGGPSTATPATGGAPAATAAAPARPPAPAGAPAPIPPPPAPRVASAPLPPAPPAPGAAGGGANPAPAASTPRPAVAPVAPAAERAVAPAAAPAAPKPAAPPAVVPAPAAVERPAAERQAATPPTWPPPAKPTPAAPAVAGTAASAVTTPPAPAPRTTGGWTVEANPTRSRQEAEELQLRLRSRGYDSTLVHVLRDGETWYRLHVGRYGSPEQASEVVRKLRDGEGVAHAFVATE